MVNAWSLAASILDGTFDEDYPIMTKKDIDEKTGLWSEPEPYQHCNYYYDYTCLLYTSPSPRDRSVSRMPSSA